MTTGFAEEMETEARVFINKLICEGELEKDLYGDDSNFKPWYSPRELIDSAVGGVDRVLIGVNPGGSPREPDHTTEERQWEAALDPGLPFNAFLDECWDGFRAGDAPLQEGVRGLYKALYEDQWAGTLRNTVCFNVCPVRTRDSRKIQTGLWNHSVDWCKQVLRGLMPTMVICNGNDNGKKSPWTVLRTSFGIDLIQCVPLGNSDRFVKFGVATVEPIEGRKVLAVPHLSWHGRWKSLPDAVSRFRDDFLSE